MCLDVQLSRHNASSTETIAWELVLCYIATTQAIPSGLFCGQYDVPMVLKYNYLVQHACKIIWRLCCSSAVLLHQKHEGKCFMFWDITRGYKKVSEDGKPPGMVLKDCKRQRAEARAVWPTVLLGAAAGLNCPQNWAQVLFWRKIVSSLCKTVQEHTVSHVVHVHQEKCDKNWGTERFTRLETRSGATQGHFIIFLLSWSAGAWSGWWEAEPGLPLLPHQSSAQERGCAPSWVKMGSFTWRVIGGIPWGELRNKLRLYPRGTCPK